MNNFVLCRWTQEGSQLKEKRMRLKISLKKACEIWGIDLEALSKAESGAINPTSYKNHVDAMDRDVEIGEKKQINSFCQDCDAPLTLNWRRCGVCGLLNSEPETALEAPANSLTVMDYETLFKQSLSDSEVDGTGYCYISDVWQRYLEISSK